MSRSLMPVFDCDHRLVLGELRSRLQSKRGPLTMRGIYGCNH